MPMSISYLKDLEAEAIHIIREAVAEAQNPVMLYSVGKDSSVMVELARKAFAPSVIPFPLMHIDTSYKFADMYKFRDEFTASRGLHLIVHRNQSAIEKNTNPFDLGADKCCALLKTQSLLEGIQKHRFDFAFGGARREEEKSRAKERVFSIRDKFGQWNPKLQRPELWNLFNCELNEGETVRVFPLSNWTEIDIWTYIQEECIPVVPLYFSSNRTVLYFKGANHTVFPLEYFTPFLKQKLFSKHSTSEFVIEENVPCRYRSLGCVPCTGAIRSEAKTVADIIIELKNDKRSERANRLIDLTSESSMEDKKKEGYF